MISEHGKHQCVHRGMLGLRIMRSGGMICEAQTWDLFTISLIGFFGISSRGKANRQCSISDLRSFRLTLRSRFLLIDSKPRRMSLVLDSELPLPLLSAVLDTLFERFQTLSVSLLSSATVTTVAAGVRSALVVNMGWSQTVVTSVYEYREVQSTQSVRAGRWLLDELYKKVIYPLVTGEDQMDEEKQDGDRVVSFEEAEDILCRLMWCRPSAFRDSQRESAQLETVEEQDETEAETAAHGGQIKGTTRVPLTTSVPPKTIDISFEKLSDVCDDTFFDQSMTAATHDDHDLPVHHLIYRHLLQLPMDVRAICMSRIIFTGGCSNILGLKQRVMDELVSMVDKRGWEPVTGKAVEAFRKNTKLNRKGSSLPSREGTPPASETGDSQSGSPASASETSQEMDPIEAKVQRQRGRTQQMQGQLRALHSLGPWAGASLACLLKQTSMATVDRDLWLQQGIHGASRPNDIDIKAAQRQSMGAGVVRGGAGQANWTLGAWGNT